MRLIAGFPFGPETRDKTDAAVMQLSLSCQEQYVLVDLDYINALPTDTARRLYSYLTKRDGKESDPKSECSEKLISLAKKLPLPKTSPSAIRLRQVASTGYPVELPQAQRPFRGLLGASLRKSAKPGRASGRPERSQDGRRPLAMARVSQS
jgi:hypothetical protein